MTYAERKETARQIAIDWQLNESDHPYSYGGIAILTNYFCPDHVVCNNCMTEMYVDYDAHVCPICGKAGCLMDIEQEVEH